MVPSNKNNSAALRRPVLAAALPLALLLAAQPATATDYVVNSTADNTTSGDNQLTLREALQAANTNAAVGDAPAGQSTGDTITFSSGLGTIQLQSAQLEITDDVSITGSVSIVAAQGNRIFNIDVGNQAGQTTILDGLTLSNGQATDGGAIAIAQGSTSVRVNNSTFTNNEATGTASSNGGGGIFNAGILSITGGSFTGNRATGTSGNGGGVMNTSSGQVTISSATFTNNTANRAGGGIENAGGSATLTNLTMTGNTVGTAPGNGGAVHSGGGTVVVNGGTFDGNTAGNEGAGLWNGATGTMTVAANSGTGAIFNNNTVSGGPSGDTTRGGGGLFNLGTMTVADATISNNSATGAVGNGGGVMNRGGSAVLTVRNSSVTGNMANRAGGGIENQGGATMTLENLTVTGNSVGSAPGNGGGFHQDGTSTATVTGGNYSSNSASAEGGGLWSAGTITINGSASTDIIINDNRASGDDAEEGGGGLFNQAGTMTVRNATINNNIADGSSGSGGGIFNNAGTLNLDAVSLSSNVANRAGGGLETKNSQGDTLVNVLFDQNNVGVAPAATAAPGNGGAVHVTGSGTSSFTNVAVTNNLAAREGGGLWAGGASTTMTVQDSFIDSNIASGVAAHDGGGGIFVNGGTLAVIRSTISNNMANGEDSVANTAGSGGGILNLTGSATLTDVILSGNSAIRAGGAIEDNANGDGGNVSAGATSTTLLRVTMSGNSTGSRPGNGGGMHITGAGTLTMSDSTVNGNSAAKEGGGLWNHAGSSMTLSTSTISGNSAPEGGGFFSQTSNTGQVNITNVTIAGNTASTSGGGIDATAGAVITLRNVIVADNGAPTGPDVAGSVNADNSLIENVTDATLTGANNVTGQDPQLVALALNAGSTQTHAIASTSPAVDGASGGSCGMDDQRGVSYPANACDIGAFEFDGIMAVVPTTTVGTGDSFVQPGENNVPLVGLGLNNDTGGNITVTGFAGRFDGHVDVASDLNSGRPFALFNDANGNGVVDAGEQDLAGDVSISVNPNGRNFSVSFSSNQPVVQNAAQQSFLLTANFAPATAAAWLLLLAPLMLLARKLQGWQRALVLVIGLPLVLAACNSSRSSLGGTADGDARLRFTIESVSVQQTGNSQPVAVQSLPVQGANVVLNR